MRHSYIIAVPLLLLVLLPDVSYARKLHLTMKAHLADNRGSFHALRRDGRAAVKPVALWQKRSMKQRKADTVQIAGSSLPDCSHACGSCSPCRLVMVSFVCASLEEAETCPMAYKCMCNNKSYPVP